jgi:transcriptional regulator with XRE-family HTH domain/quercetin dioxygenase-like cupin family protein
VVNVPGSDYTGAVAKQAPQRAGRRPARPPLEEDVGPRLRAHREQRGLSLRELARRLGVSPSAISQIETGKSRPSVSTLYSIVSELGMSLDELFGSPKAVRPRAARAAAPPAPARGTGQSRPSAERHVQRADSRATIDLESGVRWERLTPGPDHDMDFLFVTYDVGGSSSEGNRSMRHSGHEYGLVLSGKLEVTVGFDHYVLGPGDAISFDSTVPHHLTNLGDEPVRGVWVVVGRQDDSRTRGFDREPAAER